MFGLNNFMEKDKKISQLLDAPTVGDILSLLESYSKIISYGLPEEGINFSVFSFTLMESANKKEKPVYLKKPKVGIRNKIYGAPRTQAEILDLIHDNIYVIEECMMDLVLKYANWGAIYSTHQEKLEAIDSVMNRFGFNPYSSFRKIDFLIMAYCKIKGGKT